jgi:2-aminoadipate transaminase
MRLNYSGVDEAAIREGVRRIGKVVRDQLHLYSTLTGRAVPATPAPRDARAEGSAAIVDLRRRGAAGRRSA